MSTEPIVAAQIESLAVNGVALACGGNVLGFRGIPLYPDAGVFDGKLPIVTLSELGPYDPAGQFHHVAFMVPITRAAVTAFLHVEFYGENSPIVNDFAPGEAATIHLHWYVDGDRVCARFSADAPVDLMVYFNGSLAPAVVRELAAASATLQQGDFVATLTLSGEVRGACSAADVADAEVRLRGFALPAKGQAVTAHRCALSPQAPVYAVVSPRAETVDGAAIDRALAVGEAAMQARLASSAGTAADCADAIQRLVGYCTCYDPRNGRWFVPVNRDWTGPNRLPPIFMWDNFFDSYLAIWSNPELGRQSLSHILDIIATKGIVHAPPQRNLIVPVVYSKLVRSLGDEAFARESFPTMMQFVRFWFGDRGDGHPWRDGNDDGLIECGAHTQPGDVQLARVVQDAFDETGYDDSPMYSAGFAYQRVGIPAEGVAYDFARGTLNLTMIGQNSLYVAACKAMAVVAEWLGEAGEQAWLLGEAERVRTRIQERLFDPARGLFMNRFFDGSFSTVKTMTIFYPLLIDVCDEACQARLREALVDPNQFGGENVIPTVSRDDPAYRLDPWRDPYWLGNYWRGNIWAPTNYITYLALRNAGWDAEVSAFSSKSRRLFMDDWLPRHHAMENYPPVGCTPRTKLFQANGGRDPHYIWAGMLPMIALEQLFSVEDTAAGLRFGAIAEADFGAWRNFCFGGTRGSIEAGPDGVRLKLAGRLSFTSDGPIQVRRFDLATGGFAYRAPTPVRVSITCASGSRELGLPATHVFTQAAVE